MKDVICTEHWKEAMSIAMIIKNIDTLKDLTLCKLDKDEREGSVGDWS